MTGPPTYAIAVSRYPLERKIPPGDPIWSRFNAGFDNREIDPYELNDLLYHGRAITTPHKNNWRTTANYICGQHLGLDFDTGDETSTADHLAKDKFIARYASMIHTTMSHTPEQPRARVIFLLNAPIMQTQNYALATTALLWLFGTADRQCKDPARFFYGAPGGTYTMLDQVLPLEVVKESIANYKRSGAAEKRRSVRPDYLPPATQQEVAAALKRIPPWSIEYDEWVSVLMGIHAEFGEAGYPLAEHWADGKPREVEQKWRSFKPSGNGAGAVTIATVFGLAKKRGWTRAEGVV